MRETTIVLLNMRQLQAALNIRSRSTIYKMVARNALPPPCIINRRGLRWRESDISSWIAGLPSAAAAQSLERASEGTERFQGKPS